MRCNWATSASRGTLSRISVSSVSRAAIIRGSAAFLAPEIGMVPLRGLPPTMRMRSMLIPSGQCTIYRATGPCWQKPRDLRRFDGVLANISGRGEASNPEMTGSGECRRGAKPSDRADDGEDEQHQHDALHHGERRLTRRHAWRQRMQRADFQETLDDQHE